MNIKISNLSFKYDKKALNPTLDSINLEIKEGTINVLLGLNGCGKTTLIKLLAGLEKPLDGSIQYNDSELKNIKIRERAKMFSYVPQHANVTNDIPIRQYLSYGTTNTLAFYEHPGKKEMDRAEQIAERLDITHLLDKSLGEVSGGELQKVLIACSLIQNTPIMLLDEPTSALDMKNQNMVLSVLKEIAKDGKTIILSSHNPNHALFLDAHVILMNEGKIFEEGSAKELINISKLTNIYGEHLCVSKELDYEEISFK